MSIIKPDDVADLLPIRRVLASVLDKNGLENLITPIVQRGGKVISTGGTARYLREVGDIIVTEVSVVTGAEEILSGRVKTIHPKIAAALLARRNISSHMETLSAKSIEPIDLVVVNLYDFEQAVRKGMGLHETLEEIDIGGNLLLRMAMKCFPWVAMVTDPADYDDVINEMSTHNGCISWFTRLRLARKTWRYVAHYDACIARWINEDEMQF